MNGNEKARLNELLTLPGDLWIEVVLRTEEGSERVAGSVGIDQEEGVMYVDTHAVADLRDGALQVRDNVLGVVVWNGTTPRGFFTQEWRQGRAGA